MRVEITASREERRERKLFLFSFILALTFHLALLMVSPQVRIGYSFEGMQEEARRLFRVKIIEEPRPMRPSKPLKTSRKDYGTPMDGLLEGIASLEPSLPQMERLGPRDMKEAFSPLPAEEKAPASFNKPSPLTEEKIAMAVVSSDEQALSEKVEVTQRRIVPKPLEMSSLGSLPEGFSPSLSSVNKKALSSRQALPDVFSPPRPVEPSKALASLPVAKPPSVKEPEEHLLPSLIREEPLIDQDSEGTKLVSLDQILEVQLFTYKSPQEEKGYFMLKIRPKRDADDLQVIRRKVVFLIDVSKSIGQERLERLRRALEKSFRNIRPTDWFNVIAFREQVIPFRGRFVPAHAANKKDAMDFLTGLSSHGETDLYRALELLLASPVPEEAILQILMITDGFPTTGVTKTERIVQRFYNQNARKASIFALGYGTEANSYLLESLTSLNKGYVQEVRGSVEIESGLVELSGKIRDPVLTDVDVSFMEVRPEEIYPRVIGDLYLQEGLTLLGRYEEGQELLMRLVGRGVIGESELIVKKEIPHGEGGDSSLPGLWARAKAQHLLAQLALSGPDHGILSQLAFLKSKYGLRLDYPEDGDL